VLPLSPVVCAPPGRGGIPGASFPGEAPGICPSSWQGAGHRREAQRLQRQCKYVGNGRTEKVNIRNSG